MKDFPVIKVISVASIAAAYSLSLNDIDLFAGKTSIIPFLEIKIDVYLYLTWIAPLLAAYFTFYYYAFALQVFRERNDEEKKDKPIFLLIPYHLASHITKENIFYRIAIFFDALITRYLPTISLLALSIPILKIKSVMAISTYLAGFVWNSFVCTVATNKISERKYPSYSQGIKRCTNWIWRNIQEIIYLVVMGICSVVALVAFLNGRYPVIDKPIQLKVVDFQIKKPISEFARSELIIKDRDISGIVFIDSDLQNVLFRNVKILNCTFHKTKYKTENFIDSNIDSCTVE